MDETLLGVLFKRENDNYVECIRYVNLIGNLIENNDIKLRFDYDKDTETYKTNFILEYTGAPSYTYEINDEKHYELSKDHSDKLLEGKTWNGTDVYAVDGNWVGMLYIGTDKQSIPYLADLKFKIEANGSDEIKTAELKFVKNLENVKALTMDGIGYYQDRSKDFQNISYGLKYDETEHIWKLLSGDSQVIAKSHTLINFSGVPIEWTKTGVLDVLTNLTFKTYVNDDNDSLTTQHFDILNSDKFDEIIE